MLTSLFPFGVGRTRGEGKKGRRRVGEGFSAYGKLALATHSQQLRIYERG